MVLRSSAYKELYFPSKILEPEGRSWCEHFSTPPLEKLVLKTIQCNVIIIIIIITIIIVVIVVVFDGGTYWGP